MSDFESDLSSWEPPPNERKPGTFPKFPSSARTPAPEPATPPAPAAESERPAARSPGAAAAGPAPWKAAASSVPKLRQKPVEAPSDAGAFHGFAQDALPAAPGPSGARAAGIEAAIPADAEPARVTPLMAEPPFWEIWLDRVKVIPVPVALGLCAGLLLVTAISFLMLPRDRARVSLARIQQQPEAFDGRVVHVRGRAGIAFSVGGSYVFELSQGRDTIVVYSHSRRPRLHEEVTAVGTVSVGYLDGVPRVALLEDAPSP